jgi:hypothetical protein
MSIIRNGSISADLDAPVTSPTLNLDFANSQSLDSRITFTRGGIGTRVNKNGLIETLSANQPRFDYDPISGECKGLLIEESRSNSFSYSEQFDDASWIKTFLSGTITANQTTAPDGNTTADLYQEDTTLNGRFTNKSLSFTSGTSYTISIWAKKAPGSTRYLGLVLTSAAFGANVIASFNLSGPGSYVVQVSGTATSAGIQAYPNGWYRCYLTSQATATATSSLQIRLSNSPNGGTPTYNGNGTSGLYIWGAQLEVGAFPSSYIPTTTSTVTRNPDLVTIEGTKFSSWYNQTEGTFLYNGTLPFITNDPTGRVMYGVSNGFSFSNSMYATKNPSSLVMTFIVIGNNVNQSPLGGSLPNMTSSKIKIASSVSPNNIYSCGDGKAVVKTSRPSAFIPTVTKLSLGREPWNSSPQNTIIGCISKFTYYPKALSPAELQYLTQ